LPVIEDFDEDIEADADSDSGADDTASTDDAAGDEEEENTDVLLVEAGNILVDVVNAKSEMVAITPGGNKKALVN
jgi:hypothetical protein